MDENVKNNPEETAEETVEETSGQEEAPAENQVEEMEKQIADLNDQVSKLKNAYAMAYADTENMKKRLNNEFEMRMKYHIQDFAKSILPVIDNCERALAIKAEDTTDEAYRKAFEMVYKQLTASLKKEGVEEIEALNQPYDPNWMQAMMLESVEGVESGMVTAVLQKGYKLKDRLLRAAMVKVSE